MILDHLHFLTFQLRYNWSGCSASCRAGHSAIQAGHASNQAQNKQTHRTKQQKSTSDTRKAIFFERMRFGFFG